MHPFQNHDVLEHRSLGRCPRGHLHFEHFVHIQALTCVLACLYGAIRSACGDQKIGGGASSAPLLIWFLSTGRVSVVTRCTVGVVMF